jgi:hypothetical protein
MLYRPMLSVIVAPGDPERVAGLLAMLVEGVVGNLVRDVAVVGEGDLLHAVCEASGASLADDLAQAVSGARSDWLLVVPPELRLGEGWVERLADHLRDGRRDARLQGISEGFLKPRAEGVLIARARAAASAQGGLQRLARDLGRGAPRVR